MKHIETLVNNKFKCNSSVGCGECQASCQSACKTSCTVANQKCEHYISENKAETVPSFRS